MRCSALALLVVTAASLTGCAQAQSAGSDPSRSSAAPSTTTSQQPPSSSAPPSTHAAGPPEPLSAATLERVSTALAAAGVEDPGPGEQGLWTPDLSGGWRGHTAFAWIGHPDSAGQVAEVHGSVELEGTRGTATAVVHGPELSLVQVICGDLLVDVAVVVDVQRGSDDDEAAADLARALYPALGC